MHQLNTSICKDCVGVIFRNGVLLCVFLDNNLPSWQQCRLIDSSHFTPLFNESTRYNLIPVQEVSFDDHKWPAGTCVSHMLLLSFILPSYVYIFGRLYCISFPYYLSLTLSFGSLFHFSLYICPPLSSYSYALSTWTSWSSSPHWTNL